MNNTQILNKAKTALRIKTSAFDSELADLIIAAEMDLQIAGVTVPESADSLVQTAVITYVKCHFGMPENYDKLKASYDEQKAQLKTATGYRSETDV